MLQASSAALHGVNGVNGVALGTIAGGTIGAVSIEFTYIALVKPWMSESPFLTTLGTLQTLRTFSGMLHLYL
jgi:hypothetical protein